MRKSNLATKTRPTHHLRKGSFLEVPKMDMRNLLSDKHALMIKLPADKPKAPRIRTESQLIEKSQYVDYHEYQPVLNRQSKYHQRYRSGYLPRYQPEEDELESPTFNMSV